jgi:flavin-dependent dehydrogenase
MINKDTYEKFIKKKKFVLNKLRGAVYVSPLGKEINIDMKTESAYVIDRPAMEEYLFNKASKKHDFIFNKKATKKDIQNEGPVIGCDGASSIVRKTFFRYQAEVFEGAQYDLETDVEDRHLIKVFCDKRYSPFHIWSIPISNDIVKLGLGKRTGAFLSLDRFIKDERMDKKIVGSAFGKTNVGVLPRPVRGQVFLCGDSALQTKPLSGGGLSLGIQCGAILADALNKGEPDHYLSGIGNIVNKIRKECIILNRWFSLTNKQIERGFNYYQQTKIDNSTLMTPVFFGIIRGAVNI